MMELGLKQLYQNNPELVIALAGNPNTGKSTVFNALTGMNQHTGNWPGKTVALAQGFFIHRHTKINLVDLPGTYSLMANSEEEVIARDFLCFSRPDACIVITDATCLERNLNLALQVLEIIPQTLICVNLIDEARRKKISVDIPRMEAILGVPVVATAASTGEGLDDLKETAYRLVRGEIKTHPFQISYPPELEKAIGQLSPLLQDLLHLNPRWIALRLLEEDSFLSRLLQHLKPQMPRQQSCRHASS